MRANKTPGEPGGSYRSVISTNSTTSKLTRRAGSSRPADEDWPGVAAKWWCVNQQIAKPLDRTISPRPGTPGRGAGSEGQTRSRAFRLEAFQRHLRRGILEILSLW